MSVDYYALFEPVHAERKEVVEPITSVLFDLGAILETQFDQLIRTEDGLDYTFERKHCVSLADAVSQSVEFAGIEYSFVIEDASCSIIIWNDEPNKTTLAYCEPRQLFVNQITMSSARVRLFRMLIQMMTEIGSGFCVLEPEAEYKSLNTDDVLSWITKDKERYPNRWQLIVAKDHVISPSHLPASFRTENWMHIEEFNGWLWSSMGLVEPQMLLDN